MRWAISIGALNPGIWRRFPFPAPSQATSTRTSSGSRIYPRRIPTDILVTTRTNKPVFTELLTEFLSTPHNDRVHAAKLGNWLSIALLFAVGLVLMPRNVEAHGHHQAEQHAEHQQQTKPGQPRDKRSDSYDRIQADQSAVPTRLSTVGTPCPGDSDSQCCCNHDAALLSVVCLTVGPVAARILLVPPYLPQRLHFADARPFVPNPLLDSSPPRAPPASL